MSSLIGGYSQVLWTEFQKLFETKTFDIHCTITACLFVTSNVLYLLTLIQYRSRGHFDYEKFKDFDPTYIQEEWDYRSNKQTFILISGLINAMAWFSLVIPILKVIWIQSVQRKHQNQVGLHITIAVLAIGGSFTELLARILYLGTEGVSSWIASDFNLQNWTSSDSNDMIGWRTLEIVTMVTHSMLLWVDAIEWLFLFGIFMLLFISVQKSNAISSNNNNNTTTGNVLLFSIAWSYFGAMIGCICIIDFSSSLLRYQSWRFFSHISMFLTFINRVILFPIWLLWLAKQLPIAEEIVYGKTTDDTDDTTPTNSNAMNQQTNIAIPEETESTFT